MIKKMIFIIFIFFMLLSCTMDMSIIPDFWDNDCPNDFSHSLWTTNLIIQYALHYITYTKDKELFGQNEFRQTPQEVEDRKKGDCEDIGVWILSILKRDQNIEGQILLVDITGTGIPTHSMIRVEGKDYLHTKNSSYKVIKIIEFEDIPLEWAKHRYE